ncbi:MAG TPA: RNase adapter RapZ, partial [Polynucleobacter sp.]|nr:RNase adapter RapZ [Polynucleobacter sp.]
QVRVIFLNADTNTLIQRFSETRRRHPLSTSSTQSQSTTLIEAIDNERNLLEPLRAQAHSIDTSNIPAHALRSWIQDLLKDRSVGLTIVFESFGFKKGVPSEADLVFDVRCLPNPHYDKILRPHTGNDKPVQEFLEKIPEVVNMEADITQFIYRWLPHYLADGRSYLTVAIGCTGGQHRSVYLVNRLSQYFRAQKDFGNLQLSFLDRHRELDSMPVARP